VQTGPDRRGGARHVRGQTLLAFVSHLSRLKGADILAQSLQGIVDIGAGVLIFGEGEERYQKEFGPPPAASPKSRL